MSDYYGEFQADMAAIANSLAEELDATRERARLWKRAARRYRMRSHENAKLAATMVVRGASPDYVPKEVRDHIADLERRIAEFELERAERLSDAGLRKHRRDFG